MKNIRKINFWKMLYYIAGSLSILILCWMVASWMDIVAHNNPLAEGYLEYHSWNLFEIIYRMFK